MTVTCINCAHRTLSRTDLEAAGLPSSETIWFDRRRSVWLPSGTINSAPQVLAGWEQSRGRRRFLISDEYDPMMPMTKDKHDLRLLSIKSLSAIGFYEIYLATQRPHPVRYGP